MTRLAHMLPLALIGITLTNCAPIGTEQSARQADKTALGAGQFTGRNAGTTGSAELRKTMDGLVLTATLAGLPQGTKGFHLHETGRCEGPSFTTAGGHLNPLGKNHGTLAEGGSHLGDLPNLIVAPDGTATITAQIAGEQSQLLAWLFDADGTAIMVHEGPDDYTSDPSGAAGPRIACAVLTRG